LTDSSAKKRPPELVLISGGDPAGIAPEVVRKAIVGFDSTTTSFLYLYNAGHADADDEEFQRLKQALKSRLHLISGGSDDLVETARGLSETADGSVYLYPVLRPHEKPCLPGRASTHSGDLSFRALDLACSVIDAMSDDISSVALVTAPLSKEFVIRSGQSDFSGHTGYLARRFNRNVLMLMHGRGFSVIPLTEHVALADVPSQLRAVLGRSDLPALLVDLARRAVFSGKEIALCGLNPHCGEGGLIGNEEQEILMPFIEKVREAGVSIKGPLPADTLFMESVRKQFRLILSCYHDQGLIPFKALEGEQGINVTIGLPFLRTSPDHGTAYGLAGKEIADSTSMRRALEAAMSSELSH
jgi:4-hydroxythreonine-4-phosphate dehydrogenase